MRYIRRYEYKYSAFGRMRQRKAEAEAKWKQAYYAHSCWWDKYRLKGKGEWVSMEIDIRKEKGHYEIYIDGEFKCSCDVGELRETLDELRS